MGVLGYIKRVLDRGLEIVVAVVMGVLVLDVTWQVITRFVLPKPSSWTEELATFLMIWVGLLGACVALRRRAHLGIDYFVLKLPARAHQTVSIAAFTLVALFALSVMVIGGTELVVRTLRGEQTTAALRMKMGHVYLAVPISGAFMVLYSIEGMVAAIRRRGDHVEVSVSEETGVD